MYIPYKRPKKSVNCAVDDSFQAFLINGAELTEVEEYPIIPISFVPTEVPIKIMPFNKAITYNGDLSNVYICSFSPDKSFERVRRNPQLYVSFFKRTAGIIGFDFSIYSDMPIIKQKAQINDNLSLTYYFGNQGINVIPNLRCGIDELTPEFLSALPKHTLIAIGTHGFIQTMPEKYEWYCFIEQIIAELEPAGIIVYGTLSNPMFNDFKNLVPFYFYEPWITTRSKGVKSNGN